MHGLGSERDCRLYMESDYNVVEDSESIYHYVDRKAQRIKGKEFTDSIQTSAML